MTDEERRLLLLIGRILRAHIRESGPRKHLDRIDAILALGEALRAFEDIGEGT